MRAQYVSVDYCFAKPDQYRLCTSNICVPIEALCPCEINVEFRCGDGTCIPIRNQCDGTRQCARGEDEASCPGTHASLSSASSEISVSVVATIVSVCIFLCAIACLLCVFILRRRKNNTSRESQSAEPLHKGYVTPDADISDKYDGAMKQSNPNHIYYQKNNEPVSKTKYNRCNRETSNQSDENGCHKNHEVKVMEYLKNRNNEYGKSVFTKRPLQIYDIDLNTQGQGQYTFKPRLKHTNTQIYEDNFDTEEYRVLNSNKHCSGQLSLPANLNFDLDTEHFPNQFATELLCASTPRQPTRHLVKQKEHTHSVDSVTKATQNPAQTPDHRVEGQNLHVADKDGISLDF